LFDSLITFSPLGLGKETYMQQP
jgi:hypothetical protein